MVHSTKPGPADHHGHPKHHRRHPHTAAVPARSPLPARTPGVSGSKDQADPNHTTWLGWTPSLTGVRDWADHSLHELEEWFHHALSGIGTQTAGGPPVSTGSKPLAPVKGPLSVAILTKLFPDAEGTVLQQVADELNADPKKFGLDTPLRRAHFFAQVMQEGGPGLEAGEENLNYRASVLKTDWPYYKARPAEADADGSAYEGNKVVKKANHERIANRIYGGRSDLGNGSIESGDGYLFRGRGLIQATGRYNYQQITKQYQALFDGSVDFEKTPKLMAEFPYDVRSAVAFWVWKKLPAIADKGATDAIVDKVTDVVNKKTPSRAARKDNFKVAYDACK